MSKSPVGTQDYSALCDRNKISQLNLGLKRLVRKPLIGPPNQIAGVRL